MAKEKCDIEPAEKRFVDEYRAILDGIGRRRVVDSVDKDRFLRLMDNLSKEGLDVLEELAIIRKMGEYAAIFCAQSEKLDALLKELIRRSGWDPKLHSVLLQERFKEQSRERLLCEQMQIGVVRDNLVPIRTVAVVHKDVVQVYWGQTDYTPSLCFDLNSKNGNIL